MTDHTEVIRPLDPADFQRVAEIYDLSHPAEYSGESYHFPPQCLAETPALMELFDASEVFVYEDGGGIKGFVGHQGPNIIWLYVHPDEQGGGIGNRLIEFLLERQNGIALLSVVKTNRAALHLYQQRGFRPNGEYDFDYQGRSVTAQILVAGF